MCYSIEIAGEQCGPDHESRLYYWTSCDWRQILSNSVFHVESEFRDAFCVFLNDGIFAL